MARIRSIHPGIWTDEAFVSVSRDARLLFIGLWSVAEGCGVFPIDPDWIAGRVLPGAEEEIDALLYIAADAGVIRRVVVSGEEWGFIRALNKPDLPFPKEKDVRASIEVAIAKRDRPSFQDSRTGLAWSTWRQLRRWVFERDGYTCRHCGAATDVPDCDHVIPLSRGGETVISNLVTSCAACNRSRGNKLMTEWSAAT